MLNNINNFPHKHIILGISNIADHGYFFKINFISTHVPSTMTFAVVITLSLRTSIEYDRNIECKSSRTRYVALKPRIVQVPGQKLSVNVKYILYCHRYNVAAVILYV